jgi:hypothetical protein
MEQQEYSESCKRSKQAVWRRGLVKMKGYWVNIMKGLILTHVSLCASYSKWKNMRDPLIMCKITNSMPCLILDYWIKIPLHVSGINSPSSGGKAYVCCIMVLLRWLSASYCYIYALCGPGEGYKEKIILFEFSVGQEKDIKRKSQCLCFLRASFVHCVNKGPISYNLRKSQGGNLLLLYRIIYFSMF